MSEAPVNLSCLTDHFGDDHEFLHEVYTIYINDCAERLAQVGESIINRNAGECSAPAHAIKGASANIGADRILAIADEMEQRAKASDLAGVAESFKRLQTEFDLAKKFLSEFLTTLDV